jgi:L-fuculose-phosphate aldolase
MRIRTEIQLRKEICEICSKMYEKGFICATEGNVSVRLDGDEILITPSGICKGEISPEELIVINGHGQKLSGWGNPSSETAMHLKVYEMRPEIQAVVHAHPPTAIAFTLAGITLAGCIIPEVVLTMGSIPTVPYATPGTGEAAIVIEKHIHDFDALLLDRHGSITVGSSVKKAYYHLERLEHAAQVTWMAKQLGNLQSLSSSETAKILGLRQKFGIQVGSPRGCNECGICKK